jgi:hypothetical protein
MNPNDIIAHYAAERLNLLIQLEQAKARIAELEAKQPAKTEEIAQ